MTIAFTGGPYDLDPNTEMEISSSSTISAQQLRRQEGLSNTKTDVANQSLISSEEWLQLHGLKSNKLNLKQILSQIGFPHCEGRVVTERCWLENLISMLPEKARVSQLVLISLSCG